MKVNPLRNSSGAAPVRCGRRSTRRRLQGNRRDGRRKRRHPGQWRSKSDVSRRGRRNTGDACRARRAQSGGVTRRKGCERGEIAIPRKLDERVGARIGDDHSARRRDQPERIAVDAAAIRVDRDLVGAQIGDELPVGRLLGNSSLGRKAVGEMWTRRAKPASSEAWPRALGSVSNPIVTYAPPFPSSETPFGPSARPAALAYEGSPVTTRS